MEASKHLREVSDLLVDLVARVPAEVDRKAPRWHEVKALRSVPNLGRVRAGLLNAVSDDTLHMAAYCSLLLEGVADCFAVAEMRDGAINVPILNASVRPVIEVAAQVLWLLDDAADPAERVRRYLRWRFDDLRSQRLLIQVVSVERTPSTEAVAELDATESELLALVAGCGWQARPTTSSGPSDVQAAVLLDEAGRKLGVPKLHRLAEQVTRTPFVYAILSVPAHGARWGVMTGTRTGLDADGSVRMVGTGADPNLAMGMALLAVDTVGKLIAGWNRVDGERLHRAVVDLSARALIP